MHFDTIIKNGTVVTASDTFRSDVGIRDGKIAALASGLDDADEIIDASGRYVMPGGIDSHVHIAQPSGDGIVMADDFASGPCRLPLAATPRSCHSACRKRARRSGNR
jgi:dihydropyrimidinase